MSSRSFARVEWQLIMRMCDLKSLIALARCSKETLAAASTDFAWSALSPVIFRSTRPLLAECISGSLLRCADIGVRWCHPEPVWDQPPVSDEEIAAVAAIPRIRLLDTRHRHQFDPGQFDSLLTMPSAPLRQLTALYSGFISTGCDALSSESMRLLSEHCPLLRTLHAVAPRDMEMDDFAEQLSLVAGLTDVEVAIEVGQALLAYPGLQKLTLRGLHEATWTLPLTSPNMQQLKELTLVNVAAASAHGMHAPPSPIDWAACFANLHSLQSLTIEQCASIDVVLSAVLAQGSASLRCLSITVLDDGLAPYRSSRLFSFLSLVGCSAPSVEALCQLLAARLQCHLALTIESKSTHVQRWMKGAHMLTDAEDGDEEQEEGEVEEQPKSEKESEEVEDNAGEEPESDEQKKEKEKEEAKDDEEEEEPALPADASIPSAAWDAAHAAYAALQSEFPTRMRLMCNGPPPLPDADIETS